MICSANQWTGFYMVVTSVMKELMQFFIQQIREVADASSLRSMVFNTNKCNSILAFSKQKKTSIKKIYYCLIFPRLHINALMCQMDISCKNIWRTSFYPPKIISPVVAVGPVWSHEPGSYTGSSFGFRQVLQSQVGQRGRSRRIDNRMAGSRARVVLTGRYNLVYCGCELLLFWGEYCDCW